MDDHLLQEFHCDRHVDFVGGMPFYSVKQASLYFVFRLLASIEF